MQKPKVKSQNFIVSLGGSLIVPDEIDVAFLKKIRNLILVESKKGKKFLILCGGGRTCRVYQQAATDIANVSNDGLDWIGIETNRLNANLLRWVLGAKKYELIPDIKSFPKSLKSPISVALGAIRPDGSSDSASVAYAKKLSIKTIVNLTNVAGVFDRDPRKFKNAKLIPKMTWKEFRAKFGTSRQPGQHKPFDPSVARQAKRLKIKVVIMNGRDIKNLRRFLENKPFKGTIIE